MLLTVRARLTVPTAGHERKHNACRAEIGGYVSGYTCINRVHAPGLSVLRPIGSCAWRGMIADKQYQQTCQCE